MITIKAEAFHRGERWFGHRFVIPEHVAGKTIQTHGDNEEKAKLRLEEYCDRVCGKDTYTLEITQGSEQAKKEFTGR